MNILTPQEFFSELLPNQTEDFNYKLDIIESDTCTHGSKRHVPIRATKCLMIFDEKTLAHKISMFDYMSKLKHCDPYKNKKIVFITNLSCVIIEIHVMEKA